MPKLLLTIIVHYFIWSFTIVNSNGFLKSINIFAKNVTYNAMSDFGDMNYTTWPLQEGYVGLHISNLNEYVQLFQECLVNIENHQGIDLIGITSPVLITRFDIEIVRCPRYTYARELAFGKRLTSSEKSCHRPPKSFPAYDYRLTMGKWSCFAHFDLFQPEMKDAPHFFLNKVRKGKRNIFLPYSNAYPETNLGKP